MLEQPNLKDLEKSLYSKFQEDGIWDIFLGIFLLAFGLLIIFSDISYIGIVIGVMIPLIVGMKKKITEPRLGVVTFSKKRQMKQKGSYFYLMLTFVLVFAVATLLFFKSTINFDPSRTHIIEPRTLLALVLSLVLGTVAYLYEIKRFYLYSLMMMLLFSLGGLAQLNPAYMFIISGSFILVNGVTCMIAFIKKYPKLDATVESNGV